MLTLNEALKYAGLTPKPEAKQLMEGSLRSAQSKGKSMAKEFIGGPIRMVMSADLGGSDDETEVNQFAKLAKGKPVKTETIEVTSGDEEGTTVTLNFYDKNGVKFVEETVEEGGPSQSGHVFYVAKTKA